MIIKFFILINYFFLKTVDKVRLKLKVASLLTDSKSDPDKDEENRYCTWQVNGLIEMQFFKVRPQSESHFMHKYNYSL